MNNMVTNRENRPEMDDLLHNYFQAEMPHPWPAFQAPRQARTKTPVSVWSRYSGRIALAACITLLAAGYLTLAGYFPHTQSANGVLDVGPNIGLLKKEGKAAVPNVQHDEALPVPHK